eukprot:CAMPEP_0175226106 /NCGR_PEP_ID=MMETSP0093-20121207/22726_1 /TAXON_ID=311494 /ORGANISM="Alexandrium monilatum, Strain CCMP3105" /LENGTH=106 /DNA_ID=CAMNT_0016519829 /DNA_START=103 /DNA_END=419 /DNA_ORIENTATION=-
MPRQDQKMKARTFGPGPLKSGRVSTGGAFFGAASPGLAGALRSGGSVTSPWPEKQRGCASCACNSFGCSCKCNRGAAKSLPRAKQALRRAVAEATGNMAAGTPSSV